MSLEPGVALQPIDIAIKACQELQGEPQIDNGRGWAFRTSRFFAGRGLLTTRCWGARVGARGRLRGVAMPSSSYVIAVIFPTSPMQ